jgi:Uma2 family endonuclease
MVRVLPSPSMVHGTPLTLEDWAALDEDDSRELVDGALEEAEVPSVVHEVVVRFLILQLAPYFRDRGGQALGSGIKLAVGSRGGRVPDLVCFGKDARLPREGILRAAPELVVEVISSRAQDQKRDRIQKPEDYAALGVHYYWLVDPWIRTIEILELGGDRRYVRALAASDGVLEEVPGLPGLALDLGALWKELDEITG